MTASVVRRQLITQYGYLILCGYPLMQKWQSRWENLTTRMPTISLDHDFQPETTLIPYGIFLPEYNELFLFFVASKLTADCK